MDREAAIEALRQAALEDEQRNTVEVRDAVPEQATPQTKTTDGTTESLDSFTNIDPTTLPPDMQKIYKSLQGDYTRKSQEVAELRKTYESFGDPDAVKNAVEFVQALQNPANLVELHQELSEYLQSMGLNKAEADEVATTEIQARQSDDDEVYYDDPERDELRRELEEIRSFRKQYENERLQREIEAGLSKQESLIRQSNPDYSDKDIDAIYARAYVHGGNLFEAQKAWEAEKSWILSQYIDTKDSTPEGITAPATTAPGSEPLPKVSSLEEAHEMAKRKLAAIEGFDS